MPLASGGGLMMEDFQNPPIMLLFNHFMFILSISYTYYANLDFILCQILS